MTRGLLDAGWAAALHARADVAPLAPRVPLWAGGERIGSVEPGWLDGVALDDACVRQESRGGEHGWAVQGEPTQSLARIAFALRDAGVAHAWRNEQLAVTGESGRVVGTVERGVVRLLGITTFAVHLAALSSDGRHWVQQRSLTKPNDPGLWDTLMGGMVPASDSLQVALERETWEEAGLRIGQLRNLAHGGRFTMRRPTDSGRGGYVVEHLDWFRCVVPDDVVPVNQDGEVERFELMAAGDLARRLHGEEFTLEAALVLHGVGV